MRTKSLGSRTATAVDTGDNVVTTSTASRPRPTVPPEHLMSRLRRPGPLPVLVIAIGLALARFAGADSRDTALVATDSVASTRAPGARHTSAAIASCQVGARIASEVGFPLGLSLGATVCILGIIFDAQDLFGN